jgi:hypothetical protein
MKRSIHILAALLLLATGSAHAQYNETNNLFYFAQRSPQSNQLNPAFFPSTFYLSLPGMTSLQLGLPLAIGDIVAYDSTQQANIIDLNRVLDNLGESNHFRFGFDMNALGFGLKIGPVFVDANVQLRSYFNLGIPVSVINTVLKGNVNDDGTAIPEVTILDGDLFNMQMYMETSVGAGMKIPLTGLTVGVHAKLLSGLVNLQTDNTKVTFETEEDYETVRARVYYEVMGASVIPVNSDTGSLADMFKGLTVKDVAANLFDLNGNNGIAFDIGAKYDLGPFTFSAAINDLSAGIHWQKNVLSLVPKGGQGTIEFDGLDITNLLDHGTINADSLKAYLNEQVNGMMPQLLTDSADYWYSVPTKLNLGASVNLGILKAGILFHGQWDRGLLSKSSYNSLSEAMSDAQANYSEVKNTFRFNTTLSAGVNLFNWVEIIAGSSFVYDGHNKITLDNFLNPGVGIIFTPATLIQAYVMMDYASSMYLTQMKAFNFKLGFNMLIGSNRSSRIL